MGESRWWANIKSGCVSGRTLLYASRTLIYTLVYCLYEPLLTGYVCCIFWQIMRAHLLLINLPPSRKTAPPPFLPSPVTSAGRQAVRRLGVSIQVYSGAHAIHSY